MDDSKCRWRWTAEEKLTILHEARQAGHTVSEVCRRHQIQPTQFYLWKCQASPYDLIRFTRSSPTQTSSVGEGRRPRRHCAVRRRRSGPTSNGTST